MAFSMEVDCGSCREKVVGGKNQSELYSTTMFLTRECDYGLGLSVSVRPSMPVPSFTLMEADGAPRRGMAKSEMSQREFVRDASRLTHLPTDIRNADSS